MYSKQHILVLVLVTFHSALSCTFNPSEERAQCNSFADLRNDDDHTRWKKLEVINSGRGSFAPITRGTFNGYRDVKNLLVKGLASDIQPGAWDGLDTLYELHLDDNKHHVMQSGVFEGLVDCEAIYIYWCDVRDILPGVFNGVNKLRWLHFFGNNIHEIKEGVFTNTSIGTVYLKDNHIKYIQPNAFANMYRLDYLNLENNEITSFDPRLTIGSAPKVTRFYITNNQLTKISRDWFTVLPNLEILDLTHNQLRRLENYVFVDLFKLKQIDLSNNKLEELQSNVFNAKGMKNLEVLLLHDNRLSFLSLGVLVRTPNLKKITIGGNPWQCPCSAILDEYLNKKSVEILCHDLYKSGQRPTCILSDIAPKYCIFEEDTVRDLPKMFEDVLKEYPALPTTCRID